jgi:outer membrane protein assembly factor BamB
VGSNILNENIDSCSVVRGDKIYILTSNGWFNCLNASNGHSICKGKIANKFDLGFRWEDNDCSWAERQAELSNLAKYINENAKAASVQVNDVLDVIDDKIFVREKGKLKCFQRQSLKLLWAVDNFEQYRCYDNLLWPEKVGNRTIVIAKMCPDPHLRPESPYEYILRRDEEPYKRSHNYYKRKIAVFDGLNGAEIWSKVIPGFYQFYITDDGKIFALGDRLECLNCSDGNLLWSYTPPLVPSAKIRVHWHTRHVG